MFITLSLQRGGLIVGLRNEGGTGSSIFYVCWQTRVIFFSMDFLFFMFIFYLSAFLFVFFYLSDHNNDNDNNKKKL